MNDRLKDAFKSAVTLQGDARRQFLERLRTEDPALANELESLLQADERDDQGLASPVAKALASFGEDREDLWSGRELGPWRIVSRIAAGGMGSVFRAERADRQYEQVVAIKIMTAQLLSPDAMRRFRTERQILANLSHPYIARLLDGGTTDEELPYLVMEYIDGQPINRWCDEQGLDVRDRIRLFLQVCEAVQHAHTQLVVHRDLKPSNILVDANGTPKLLDFGIARLVDSDAVPHASDLTRAGSQALTPDYASPEQIRGEPVSVATDVYSLGVLLYTLLSGRLPFEQASSRPDEKLAAILDTEPDRPSDAVTADSDPDTGKHRRTTSTRLKKLLAGDLDNIVLMALRKEPERRYASVAAFAADLQKYLEHRPVAARPDHFAYRARRFIRRNAVGVATGALLAALVSGFTVSTAVQNERIARERDIAEQERNTSQRVSEFLVSLFEVADPNEARGNTVTAREVVDRAVETLSTELEDEPAVRAELVQTLGRVYRHLGLYEDAERLLRDALAEREALYGVGSLETAEALFEIALLHELRRNFDDAQTAHEAALAIRRKHLPADHALVADSLFALGGVHLVKRENDTSYDLLTQALAIREAIHDEPHFDVGSARNDLALIQWRRGEHAAAEENWRRALEINRQVLGEDHPELRHNLNNVAWSLARRGKGSESLVYYEAALELVEKTLDAGHPGLLRPMHNLAFGLVDSGRFERAETLIRRALPLAETKDPYNEQDRLSFISLLAEVHRQRGEYDQARELLLEVLAKGKSPYNAPEISASYLALVCLQQGDTESAEAYARQTVELTASKPAWSTGPWRLAANTTLARLHGNDQYIDAAYDAAVNVELWISSMRHLTHLVNLAEMLVERGDDERAARVIAQAETVLELGPGRDHPAAAALFARLR